MVNYVAHVPRHNYKERERKREGDRPALLFATFATIPRLTWLVGAQWDVKYLNNGFIMRSSARRVHGGANGYGIVAISYENAKNA